MIVELAYAREHGLTIEYPEREYGFCSAGCLETFAKNVAKVDGWFADKADAHASGPDAHTRSSEGAVPEIDAGMRAWYASCRCCLSDAHPSIVEALDKERAEAHQTPTT